MKLEDIEALRTRSEDDPGPSSLDLDRLAARLRDPELEAQVEADPALRNALARRRQGLDAVPGLDAAALKARIVAAVESPTPQPAPRPARWLAWLRTPWLWTGLAATAAVAVFALRPETPLETPPEVRAKGALKLMVFRQVASGAVEAISGDAFHAGDRLKFKVTLPAKGQVRVVGIDATGTLYTAWPLPEHAGTSTTLDAADALPLPGAIALDDSPGAEQLHLVHCPPEVEPACQAAGVGAPPVCPPACATTPFTLNKAP